MIVEPGVHELPPEDAAATSSEKEQEKAVF